MLENFPMAVEWDLGGLVCLSLRPQWCLSMYLEVMDDEKVWYGSDGQRMEDRAGLSKCLSEMPDAVGWALNAALRQMVSRLGAWRKGRRYVGQTRRIKCGT